MLRERTEDGIIEAGNRCERGDAGLGGGSGLRILVLEDDTITGMSLAQALTDRDCEVCGPHSKPSAALAALSARGPDAALLDVSLGGDETSLPVADALAARGVPFAFVTGYGPETAAVVAAHPDRLVIPKPVDPETVGMLLDELLPGASGRARGAA